MHLSALALVLASNGSAFWFASRSAGVVGYVLLAASTILGVMINTRLVDGLMARPFVAEMHKFTSLLALGFTAGHVLTLPFDDYISFGWQGILIPLQSSYRPLWVGLGVIGLYGAIAVTASFYIRRRFSYQAWRNLHYCTYGVFVLLFIHAIFSGSDSSRLWIQYVYLVTGGVALFCIFYRILWERRQPRPEGAAAAVAHPKAARGNRPSRGR